MSAKESSVTDTTPWITCHVLDTVGGKPAADVRVRLMLLQSKQTEEVQWSGTTNQDGRIQEWHGQHLIREFADREESGDLKWELTFDSELYFGKGNTFFPEVRIVFATKSDQKHYHVPLLLGPWSYTTYRGS